MHIFVGVGIGNLASWVTAVSQTSQSKIAAVSQTAGPKNNNIWKTSIEMGLGDVAITMILQHRYTLLDRSSPDDAVMKHYGMNILDR